MGKAGGAGTRSFSPSNILSISALLLVLMLLTPESPVGMAISKGQPQVSNSVSATKYIADLMEIDSSQQPTILTNAEGILDIDPKTPGTVWVKNPPAWKGTPIHLQSILPQITYSLQSGQIFKIPFIRNSAKTSSKQLYGNKRYDYDLVFRYGTNVFGVPTTFIGLEARPISGWSRLTGAAAGGSPSPAPAEPSWLGTFRNELNALVTQVATTDWGSLLDELNDDIPLLPPIGWTSAGPSSGPSLFSGPSVRLSEDLDLDIGWDPDSGVFLKMSIKF